MGMDGGMGPPGSQNSMGPSNSESSMYSPSRYPSQQRSALVSSWLRHIENENNILKKKIVFLVSDGTHPFLLACSRHDGYSQQYPSMPYGMHPSGMYSQQQVRNCFNFNSKAAVFTGLKDQMISKSQRSELPDRIESRRNHVQHSAPPEPLNPRQLT